MKISDYNLVRFNATLLKMAEHKNLAFVLEPLLFRGSCGIPYLRTNKSISKNLLSQGSVVSGGFTYNVKKNQYSSKLFLYKKDLFALGKHSGIKQFITERVKHNVTTEVFKHSYGNYEIGIFIDEN